ncbi:hypothetical protein AC1031_020885 [Aphanomyces cochlioides]|nr:hypothetical protein AC1031_020885 [Aphanomyces cochlioides]
MEKEEGQALLDHSSSSSSMEEANHGPRKTMSARNSTFWLQVVAQSHSDMSLQASSPSFTRSLSLPESTHSIATIPGEAVVREEDGIDSVDEVIYEHERYQIVLGWGAKGCLLPMDPKKYTNATYTMHYPIFPTIALPSASQKDGIWEWTTPWKLDIHMGTDKDGWQYASNFNHLRQGGPSCSATHRSTTFTRRRKWYRTRTLIPMSNRLVNVGVGKDTLHALCSALDLDDSLLDRKSGWLNKQGHVRKNWKRRFFVLDGSVLQYFSDDVDSSVQKSKTHKLKGEVLLFHKDTTVRYVDATLSGRDFTFAIDSGEYSLQLQASSLDEREDWVFAVEDAILCRESYTEDERTNKVRSNRRRSLTHVYSPQTKAISTRIIKAHSENISNFVTTFKLHYTIEGAIDEPTLVGALKSFRIFVERILVKGMERYREYMIQNKQEIENTYAEARDLLLVP